MPFAANASLGAQATPPSSVGTVVMSIFSKVREDGFIAQAALKTFASGASRRGPIDGGRRRRMKTNSLEGNDGTKHVAPKTASLSTTQTLRFCNLIVAVIAEAVFLICYLFEQ